MENIDITDSTKNTETTDKINRPLEVLNKETNIEYQCLINTYEFDYVDTTNITTTNTSKVTKTAKVNDYLIVDEKDKLIEALNEEHFHDKYFILADESL